MKHIKNLILKLFQLIPFLFLGNFVFAESELKFTQSLVPGGVAVIDLGEVIKDDNNQPQNKPIVSFENNRITVVEELGNWRAIVGIPLSTDPKDNLKVLSVNITQQDKSYVKDIPLTSKKYPSQYLTIKNQRMVEPLPADLERITAEREITAKARYYWDDADATINFVRPLSGKMSSIYGVQRFFNKIPRQPHSGIDIPARAGTPVKSIEKGRVILTGDFYYNGNTVFISHGQGVVSLYVHLKEINVEEGQIVDTNTIIGKVGTTGRSTGPHLHLGIYFNGVPIDPEIFLSYQKR